MNNEQYSNSNLNNVKPEWNIAPEENSAEDKKAYANEEVPASNLNPMPSDAAPELNADVATNPESEPINPTQDSFDSDTNFDNTEKPSSDLNPLPEDNEDKGPEEGTSFNSH